MNRLLDQREIDTLVEALHSLKNYGDEASISTDLLRAQVVLTQSQIDHLIESLKTAKDSSELRPDVNVALSQPEIDSLIDALNTIKEYDDLSGLTHEIDSNQSILSQKEIDVIIDKLLSMKKD